MGYSDNMNYPSQISSEESSIEGGEGEFFQSYQKERHPSSNGENNAVDIVQAADGSYYYEGLDEEMILDMEGTPDIIRDMARPISGGMMRH